MIILVFVNFVLHKPTHRPKITKELPPLPPKKNLKIFFQRFKNNKKRTAQPTLKDEPRFPQPANPQQFYKNDTEKIDNIFTFWCYIIFERNKLM